MHVIMAIAGAAVYRWRGKSHPWKKYTPRPVMQIVFALPYAFACMPPNGSWWAVLPVLVLTTLGVLTGMGNFFLQGTGGKDETLEFSIKWLKPHMPLYWYRALGLSITGLAITLPAGLVLMNPYIALSGVLKGAGYVLADKLKGGTEMGEFLTGALLWSSLSIAL